MVVYTAVILTVLLAFCGLAIDVGRMQLRALQLQNAADAGALTAAAELQRITATNYNNASQSSWQTAAAADVAANESLNGIPNAPPDTPLQGPLVGPYLGDMSAVQVSIHQNVATNFLGVLGSASSSLTLTVNSIAVMPPCVYTFSNPAVNNGFSNNGWGMHLASMGLTTNCPVYSKTGIFVDGFANICCAQEKNSGASLATTLAGWAWPNMLYAAPVLTDPLAYIKAPVFTSCTYTNKSYIAPATIQPGTYCGGLTVTNTTLTMNPGLYMVTGGVTVSNSTLNGSGVTMYLTKGGGSGFGTFNLLAGSKMLVNAPTNAAKGGVPGVVIFGDRAWVGGNEDFQFKFSTFKGDGVIYTSNTGIYDWITDMSGTNYFNVVTANWYTYLSNVTMTADYSSLTYGNPLHTAVALVQ